MNNKTLKPGQAVLYKPKDLSGRVYKVEEGIVKRMSKNGTKAFVWYHSGCTAAPTSLEYLEATEPTEAHKDIHRGCKECEKLIMKKQQSTLESLNKFEELRIPKYLYHATYMPFLKSIKEKGLGNTERTMWSDSVRGVVYLADDADVARSYAENSEWLEDIEEYSKYMNSIIILKIDSDKLDRTKLKRDANVIDGGITFEYHGIIYFDSIEEVIE